MLAKKTRELLEARRSALSKSETYADSKARIRRELPSADSVRCLALGSPSSEFNALYQLAFLLLICEEYEISLERVSLYDPAFTEADLELFGDLGLTVSERNPLKGAVYYMPHAPVEVIEAILATEQPTVMLTNDLRRYEDRMTLQELFGKFPNVARVAHLGGTTVPSKEDGFEVVRPKKNRKNRKRVEMKVDYKLEESYFKKCSVEEVLGGSITAFEWKDSFSCLALHTLEASSGKACDGEGKEAEDEENRDQNE